ncbi:hypothetical protein D3C80_1967900 [compost metagenome]
MALINLPDERFTLFLTDKLEKGVDLGLDAIVVFFGRRRADVEEVGQPDDLPEQLQELRLPVLEGVTAHLDQVGVHLRRLAVLARLVDEGGPSKAPVQSEGDQEET